MSTFFSFSGGLSNFLYYCALPETQVPVANEPAKVLLRIYGQDDSNMQTKFITECVIFTLLSENNRGPRLHGVFPGGRLEEYIPVRPLKITKINYKNNKNVSGVVKRIKKNFLKRTTLVLNEFFLLFYLIRRGL